MVAARPAPGADAAGCALMCAAVHLVECAAECLPVCAAGFAAECRPSGHGPGPRRPALFRPGLPRPIRP
ncbi:hypothetical protein, partial [Microbispora triticiradicis]|uniref:hypothetical protein n=1 Tax=Microbispora triticiradicis TaxID=2200763 RepID=UPI001AD66083